MPKSSWKPQLGHPNLEVFLSQVEMNYLKNLKNRLVTLIRKRNGKP